MTCPDTCKRCATTIILKSGRELRHTPWIGGAHNVIDPNGEVARLSENEWQEYCDAMKASVVR